jgi:hypothetical protein
VTVLPDVEDRHRCRSQAHCCRDAEGPAGGRNDRRPNRRSAPNRAPAQGYDGQDRITRPRMPGSVDNCTKLFVEIMKVWADTPMTTAFPMITDMGSGWGSSERVAHGPLDAGQTPRVKLCVLRPQPSSMSLLSPLNRKILLRVFAGTFGPRQNVRVRVGSDTKNGARRQSLRLP